VEEKSVNSPEVLPGETNAMKKCPHRNERLITISSEVDVRFIALFSPFGRTQDPDCEVGEVT